MRLGVDGLVKRFDRRGPPVLDGVTFEAPLGSLTCLLGPSGVGKSTVLGIIAGLEAADAGQVSVGDRPIDGLPAHRRPVTLVMQHPQLFPHLTVAENVAFGLRVRGIDRAARQGQALELMGLVGIDTLARHPRPRRSARPRRPARAAGTGPGHRRRHAPSALRRSEQRSQRSAPGLRQRAHRHPRARAPPRRPNVPGCDRRQRPRPAAGPAALDVGDRPERQHLGRAAGPNTVTGTTTALRFQGSAVEARIEAEGLTLVAH